MWYQQSLKSGTFLSHTINPSVTLCFQSFQQLHLMVKINWPIFSSIHYLTTHIKTDTRLPSGKHSKIIPSQSLTQVAYLYNLSQHLKFTIHILFKMINLPHVMFQPLSFPGIFYTKVNFHYQMKLLPKISLLSRVSHVDFCSQMLSRFVVAFGL